MTSRRIGTYSGSTLMNEKQSVYERILGSSGAPPDDGGARGRHFSRRRVLLAAGAAASLLVCFGLGVAVSQPGGILGFWTRSEPQPAASDGKDLFTAHALANGVKTCAATYALLGKALTAGANFAFQTQVAETAPNQHAVQGTVGMRFAGNPRLAGQAAGVILAAPTATSCEGNSVRVIPIKQRCEDATSLLPPGSKLMSPLSDLPFYALPTGEQTLFLPVGDYCVAVTTLRSGS
ncbi:hypothetical protein [Roseixanthobacter liquoris]|uniref:hypothetical protein n=1 Tax=Roseixanthobacter liquoris TaxID=3119921 RepID=UPI00372C6B0D